MDGVAVIELWMVTMMSQCKRALHSDEAWTMNSGSWVHWAKEMAGKDEDLVFQLPWISDDQLEFYRKSKRGDLETFLPSRISSSADKYKSFQEWKLKVKFMSHVRSSSGSCRVGRDQFRPRYLSDGTLDIAWNRPLAWIKSSRERLADHVIVSKIKGAIQRKSASDVIKKLCTGGPIENKQKVSNKRQQSVLWRKIISRNNLYE